MVTLFTRPRRFDKTLAINTIKTFFEKTDEDTARYFTDKKIWQCGDKYRALQGKYPVIMLTFKDVKYNSWEESMEAIRLVVKDEYKRHPELAESSVLDMDARNYIDRMERGALSGVELQRSLLNLAHISTYEELMAEYITTYTGIHMIPSEPKPEDFRIEDIAHALSLICRGNGHVKTFWSVGQHCIACAKEAAARQLPDRIVLACLLHDAGECYLSDVPRPVKKEMPAYRSVEEKLLSVIYQKFLGSDLTEEESRIVKEIDDALLWYDLENLLGELQLGKIPEIHIGLSYEVRPFTDVEEEYLELYYQYSDKEMPKTV